MENDMDIPSITLNTYWTQNFKPIPHQFYYFLILIYTFIGIVGLVGNVMVLVLYFRYKTLRTPSNYFVINITISDLILLLTNIPLSILSCWYNEWIFGRAGCNFYAACGSIFGFLNISVMTFRALEKSIVIKKPFSALKKDKRFTLISITLSWIYASIWSFLPFFGSGFVLDGIKTQCGFNYINTEKRERIIIISMVIGGFLIPVGVMTACYTYIIMKLKDRKNLQLEFLEKSKSVKTKTEIVVSNEDEDTKGQSINAAEEAKAKVNNDESTEPLNKKKAKISEVDKKMNLFIKSEIKATKNALVIITLFTIAWFPYCIISLISQFSVNRAYYVTPYTGSLAALFAKTSAIYNPIVYALSNRKFKIKFGKFCPYFGRHVRTFRRSFMSRSFMSTSFGGSIRRNQSSGTNDSFKNKKTERSKTCESSSFK